MANTNADYNKLMDEKGNIQFPKLYDEAMDKIGKEMQLPPELLSKLYEKRNFGLEKYGDRAFQSSLQNTLTSPAVAHLGDEIIDAFNYAMHNYYVCAMRMDDEGAGIFKGIVNRLGALSATLRDARDHIKESDPEQAKSLDWTERFDEGDWGEFI